MHFYGFGYRWHAFISVKWVSCQSLYLCCVIDTIYPTKQILYKHGGIKYCWLEKRGRSRISGQLRQGYPLLPNWGWGTSASSSIVVWGGALEDQVRKLGGLGEHLPCCQLYLFQATVYPLGRLALVRYARV